MRFPSDVYSTYRVCGRQYHSSVSFYKHKLKNPIEELELASQQVGRNNLDFHITYENKDEMGRLCREFERMKEQLAENNHQLWK